MWYFYVLYGVIGAIVGLAIMVFSEPEDSMGSGVTGVMSIFAWPMFVAFGAFYLLVIGFEDVSDKVRDRCKG